MITFKARDFYYTNGKDRVEGECLSTDTKPTTYANGSVLIEMDTGDRFMFDEDNGEWLNITNPGGGGDAEVWFTGNQYEDYKGKRTFDLVNEGEANHATELATNGMNYKVFLNGTELPSYSVIDEIVYFMGDIGYVMVDNNNQENIYAQAAYLDASTAPTSVEVSVKAK